MTWLTEPLSVSLVQRGLLAGLLVSVICAPVGTWVVLRGMAFLGDAMAHGVLPGVALASLLGLDPLVGAAASAGVIAAGVTRLSRLRRLRPDTSIGLLFVGMLALGVILVSHSRSFATDLTAFLFGDVLAVRPAELTGLAVAAGVTLAASVAGHRSFAASTFDPRIAHSLGLRPARAHAALLALVALAIVASFHVVGTLLVFGLLVAPPAAALLWARGIPRMMVGAALVGSAATAAGLLVSWHLATAAGATIAACAVGLFFLSAALAAVRDRVRDRVRPTAAAASPPARAEPTR